MTEENPLDLFNFQTHAEPLFSGEMSVDEIFDRLTKESKSALIAPDKQQSTFWENFGIPGPLTFSIKGKDPNKGRMTIVDGRRRLWYALDRETEKVKVEIYQYDGLTIAAVGLGMNSARTVNPASDAQMIRNLIDESKAKGETLSESQVAKLTGMPVSTVKARLVFANLPGDILQAFVDGKIKKTAAGMIAKDPTAVPEIRRILREVGKVTVDDVKGVRKVEGETLFLDLPEEVFAPTRPGPVFLILEPDRETPPEIVGYVFDKKAAEDIIDRSPLHYVYKEVPYMESPMK